MNTVEDVWLNVTGKFPNLQTTAQENVLVSVLKLQTFLLILPLLFAFLNVLKDFGPAIQQGNVFRHVRQCSQTTTQVDALKIVLNICLHMLIFKPIPVI